VIERIAERVGGGRYIFTRKSRLGLSIMAVVVMVMVVMERADG